MAKTKYYTLMNFGDKEMNRRALNLISGAGIPEVKNPHVFERFENGKGHFSVSQQHEYGKWLAFWTCASEHKTLRSLQESNGSCVYEVVSLPELLELLSPKTITVAINCEYSAVVSKDTIKVGCQEFPASRLYELVEAHKEVSVG